ncbi:MAG: hypothetical protein QOE65_675 [Solirubrobacteraceae bacterium]|jgi:hypothetical protein|nr:hypothetical protein [Solirubrobacteraceae bacterium]
MTCAATPAHAGVGPPGTYVTDASTHGTIVVSWRGDPARGCGEAGMCGESGGFTLRPNLRGELEILHFGRRWESYGSGSMGSDETPVVVRARHDEPGHDPGLCIQPLPVQLSLEIAAGPGGASRLGFGSIIGFFSSGRCAGPTALDLADALPHADIDVPRLRREPVSLRLAGRRAFAAGPLAGEVAYDVALRFAHLRLSQNASRETGAGSEPRSAVEIAYRVERLTARTTVDFAGLPELGCEVLDGCGTTGIVTRTFDAPGGNARVDAVPAGGRSPVGRAAVLSAFRAGRMSVYGSVEPRFDARGAVTVEELRASGTAGCRDTAPGPGVAVEMSSARRTVTLRPTSDLGTPDPLRARCPGPARADVLGDRRGATGTVAPADLLRSHVTLRLGGDGRFAGKGYGGRHATTIVAELRREKLIVRGGRR